MSVKRRKVVIIGAGHVGSHIGFSLVTQGVCDELVYIDIDKDKAIAQTEDTADATVYCPHHVEVKAGDYNDLDDADIAVISAGPLPDMSKGEDRVTAMGKTMRCMGSIVEGIKSSNFSGIIISITNPADVIARYIQHKTGYPEKKLISTSTTLDSSRLRKELSKNLGIDQKSIYAYALGEHGESQMVPWSCATVFGKPLLKLMEEYPDTYGKLDLNKIAADARYGGWLVLSGKGSTEFGIGASAVEIIKTIFGDEKKVCTVSVMLHGEYGQSDVYASVPAIIGKDGVEGVIEIDMTEDELKLFADSCDSMRKNFELSLTM
ncbi:L-lactate dehydrogenase 1 [Clostridiales bacterium]|nr:L-lactate dehydrogenase 1 [Clostridiales bacterium]